MNPCADAGFQTRMDQAAKLAGNATRLAEKTGISRRAIGEYLAGKAEPSRPRLVAIAAAAGVRVQWLATGEGPMQPGDTAPAPAPSDAIDSRLLAAVHKGIAEIYKAENIRIYADPLADEVAGIYAELVATYDSAEDRQTGLKLMLNQLRRRLQAPGAAGANSKQVS